MPETIPTWSSFEILLSPGVMSRSPQCGIMSEQMDILMLVPSDVDISVPLLKQMSAFST
jgi:hypothetical protein